MQGRPQGSSGTGNVGWDVLHHYPEFIDPDGLDDIPGTEDDDLRRLTASPCVDDGSNLLVPADVFDLDDDGDLTEPVPFDLRGAPRFLDEETAPDCPNGGNCGTAPIVDMGAYELEFDKDVSRSTVG